MTKEDFYILRNSITMRQVAEYYGFPIDRKGFIKCPFHGNGTERTPSLKIYEGFRGFHCKGCGIGGDVSKFVELLDGVSRKDAGLLLSRRFNIPISENSEIPPETLQRANEARLKRESAIAKQSQVQAELRQICAYLVAYNQLMNESEPFSEVWCCCQNEIPKLIGRWESLFNLLEKV
jgi:DNA primase